MAPSRHTSHPAILMLLLFALLIAIIALLPGTAPAHGQGSGPGEPTREPPPTFTPAPPFAAPGSESVASASPVEADTGPGEMAPAEPENPAPAAALDPAPAAVPPGDPVFASDDLGIIGGGADSVLVSAQLVSIGANTRDIYARGLALGNNPHAFSKIGDCNSEVPYFLARFDRGDYDLGDAYAYLQPTIDYFGGSFARESRGVWTGNHAWALFDPVWANPAYCLPGEMPIACEFRLHQPSIVLVRLGTNETGTATALFEENLRRIVVFSIERGVVPILGTKADRLEGGDHFNEVVRRLARDYGVPLWDFGREVEALPANGLMPDGIHLTLTDPLYGDGGYGLTSGHGLQNLTALMALHTVRIAVADVGLESDGAPGGDLGIIE